ncbi:10308_t:CDS:2, partial [Racocetra persica]
MDNVTQSSRNEANSTHSTPMRVRQLGISETTPKRRGILKSVSNVTNNKPPSTVPSVTFNEPKLKERNHNSGLIK